MNRHIARSNLIDVLGKITRTLDVKGHSLARDAKEPGRVKKAMYDARMKARVQQHFHDQAQAIRKALTFKYPERKAISDIPNMDDLIEWDDPEFEYDLMMMLIMSSKDGVELFKKATLLGMDYSMVNQRAAGWAQRYAGKLVKGIDGTTRQAVRNAISKFISTPGMTIGDTMDLLPFGEARSELVAVTEITRAYAQANQIAGEAAKEKYPDVRVTKTWFTNNDSLVCDICEPLDGAEVDIDEEFAPGIDMPGDSHPGCRCWTSTGTRIDTNTNA